MSIKALALVLVAAAVIVFGVLAMHGKGHAALAKWMPSIHGGHR
jgi:hypothetical protein